MAPILQAVGKERPSVMIATLLPKSSDSARQAIRS